MTASVPGAWSMPWNARDGVGRLGPGIPKSDFWASAKEGIDQVGCVYTAQGFEYDYVGVIFGTVTFLSSYFEPQRLLRRRVARRKRRAPARPALSLASRTIGVRARGSRRTPRQL